MTSTLTTDYDGWRETGVRVPHGQMYSAERTVWQTFHSRTRTSCAAMLHSSVQYFTSERCTRGGYANRHNLHRWRSRAGVGCCKGPFSVTMAHLTDRYIGPSEHGRQSHLDPMLREVRMRQAAGVYLVYTCNSRDINTVVRYARFRSITLTPPQATDMWP